MPYFVPSDFGFFEKPKFGFFLKNGEFDVENYESISVNDSGSGVYVWTVVDDKGRITPLRFGFYGKGLINRVRQDKRGLNEKLDEKNPVNYFLNYVRPRAISYLNEYQKIYIYSGSFEESAADALNKKLLEIFKPELSFRK